MTWKGILMSINLRGNGYLYKLLNDFTIATNLAITQAILISVKESR
jgi:hypothetical protein